MNKDKKLGELTDDELDHVSGGMFAGDGRLIVTLGYRCGDKEWSYWRCKTHNCGMVIAEGESIPWCGSGRHPANCGNCQYCVYERGLWLCGRAQNNRQ